MAVPVSRRQRHDNKIAGRASKETKASRPQPPDTNTIVTYLVTAFHIGWTVTNYLKAAILAERPSRKTKGVEPSTDDRFS